MKYPDKIDLYDDSGKQVDSNVPIEAISPVTNSAIRKIVSTVKRTVAVDLKGVERALATGSVGGEGCVIRGRELKLDIVKNAGAIADALTKHLRVKPGDDTEVKVFRNGENLLVTVPSARLDSGVEYTTGFTSVAAALTCAIIDIFKVDIWDYDMVHAGVWGRYPQSVDTMASNVRSLLAVPQQNEGMGYALRNISCSHVALITRKNAMNAAALSAILEQTAMYEMGDAVGPFERLHLLGLAYQGLNANNVTYNLVRDNGEKGTLGDVVRSAVGKALEDGVIKPLSKQESGYVPYATDDLSKWNAYAASGMLAGTMITCGAARSMQHITSVLVYFNDLVERETGLPGVDFGRAEGTGVEMSFFSHSIYGGGNPGVFQGNHIVTRHSKGFVIPCVSAAIALDAGTTYYTPERISGVVGEVLGEIPWLREPIKHVAEAAGQIKGEV